MAVHPQSGRCPLCRIPGSVVHYASRPDGAGGQVSTAVGYDCPNARCANYSPSSFRAPRRRPR
ncbi:MAG TPA: hypothetical protein VGN59_18795 [Acidimicrobiia bacterium]